MKTAIAIITTAFVSVSMAGERAAPKRESMESATWNSVSLHLASTTSVRGFEPRDLGNDGMVHVSPQAALCGEDVTSAEAIATREGADLLLTLTDEAAVHFARLLGERGMDQLAIVSGKRLMAAGRVSFDAVAGIATVSDLPEARARHLASLAGRTPAAPTGPAMTVVPAKRTLSPGESTTLDIFLSGVADLRTFQVALTITGGTSGNLTVEDLSVDTGRLDYVFNECYQLEAVDRTIGRIGALLFAGGVDATDVSYLGSYTVRASADASGVFHIGVRKDGQSHLSDAADKPIKFGPGPPATILVSASPRPLMDR